MSALSDAAATLPVGQWTTVTATTGLLAAIHDPPLYSNQNHISYSNASGWDFTNREMRFWGSDHYGPPTQGPMRNITFADDTDTWSVSEIPFGSPVVGRHGYCHNAVNPYNGELYYRDYGTRNIYSQPRGGSPALKTQWNATKYEGAPAIGVCWWSGSFQGAGAHGVLIVHNDGATGGQLLAYDPLADNWIINGNDFVGYASGADSYNGLAVYSAARNCAIFGGGNSPQNQKVWRLNADRSYTVMTDAPFSYGIGSGLLTVDPVTGNFLLIRISDGTFYELDPTGATGTWAQLTGNRVPPAGLVTRLNASPAGGIAFPVSNYGVLCIVGSTASNNSAVLYMYKHALSTQPPPIANLALVRL